MRTSRRKTALVVLALAIPLAIASCSSSSHGHASSVASSLAANPTYSAEVNQLESELLANFKKDFKTTHPITSMEEAVRDTFPGGSSTKIVNYAVKTFTLSKAHGKARQAWIQSVVTYALAQGATATGVGTGQPKVPGTTTSPPASPSPAGSLS